MSAEPGYDAARHSNGSNPAQPDSGPVPSDSENGDHPEERPDVPTPEERLSGLMQEYPERCMVPVSETHGTKLRDEALADAETVERSVSVGNHEEVVVSRTTEREALPLIAVVEELLEMYESYRDMHLRMEKREGRHAEPESFLIPLENSYTPEYQSGQYARLSAWERQICGGEYPSGEEVSGEFVRPVTALLSLTASSFREAGESSSGHRPICDHDRAVRDAWVGSSDSVKRTLRYVLEDKLGLPSDAYTWWWQSEPHPGDGDAAGYSHAHPVVVLDGAAASVPAEDIGAETFRPVVAKHVAECEGATWDAHGLDDAVEVRQDGEINSLSGYVAKYVACDPDADLLERSDEYLMWAASQWATTTQKYSRDRVAASSTKADACHQRYVSSESDQEHDHGDVVVRSRKPGVSFECAECGSSFGIDQERTLTEHRTAQPAAGPACVADGGEEVSESSESSAGLSDRLRGRWRGAREAAVVGGDAVARECDHAEADTCPLCATETESPEHTVSGEVPIPDHAEPPSAAEEESASFRRAARWRPSSVVRVWSGEETDVGGAPSGVDYGEVVVAGAGAAVRQMPERCRPLPPSSWLEGPEPWERHPVAESDVRGGELPPPEVVAREMAERHRGDRVTPKEWPDDWYARRFERSSESESEPGGLDDRDRRRVEELVETGSVSSVAELVGRLQLPPSAVDEVRELVDGG